MDRIGMRMHKDCINTIQLQIVLYRWFLIDIKYNINIHNRQYTKPSYMTVAF